MKEFFEFLAFEWWGIAILVLFSIFLWLGLSALFYRVFFKRFYDILLSGLAVIILSPLLLTLTILGALKMKGNPFFIQVRPGKIDKKTGEEKLFRLIKFRTMTCQKDENGKLLPDEKRLTKYGRILRSTSLDELPELINIFIGDMSLVGPRPQLVRDMVFMTKRQRERHRVRSGLTGLAQVAGRNNISWEQKLDLDLQYISRITFWKDLKILLLTVYKVFKRSDIERDGTVSDIDFGDWLLSKGAVEKVEYEEKQKSAENILQKYLM